MKLEELYKKYKENPFICTDTRNIQKGSIFFALKGEHFNGNEYCEEALNKGCVLAVSDEKEGAQIVKVKDVLRTLQELANLHRNKMSAKIIGITGSNGKTTTKEIMKSILSERYNVLATEGNLNNHIGVPLTLLKITSDHEIAIIEMGANQPGDIKELCEIAEPEWGLITNIGKAHLEGFGSIDTTLKTKVALYESVHANNGKIFLNADDPLLKKSCPERHPYSYAVKAKTVDLFGNVEEEHPVLKMSWSNYMYHSPSIESQLVGAYNVYNIIAAVSIADALKMKPQDINRGIRNYVPSNHRSQIIKTSDNTLIMDAYNANPASMRNAVESFLSRGVDNGLLILGDMKELGEYSKKEHQDIIKIVKDSGLEALFIGKEFDQYKIKSKRLQYFKDKKEAISYIEKNKFKDRFILLKASRSIGLEELENYF